MPNAFKVGDKFTVDPAVYPAQCHGVVYEVTKVPVGANGKNYTGSADSGGRGVKAQEAFMTAHDPAATPVVEVIPYLPVPVHQVVTVHGHPKMNPSDLYFVQDASRKPNAAKLVKVGGDNGRYWPSVPVSMLTVVQVAAVQETP